MLKVLLVISQVLLKIQRLALVEYPKLFKKAGIEFKVPTSSADKPQDISSFL